MTTGCILYDYQYERLEEFPACTPVVVEATAPVVLTRALQTIVSLRQDLRVVHWPMAMLGEGELEQALPFVAADRRLVVLPEAKPDLPTLLRCVPMLRKKGLFVHLELDTPRDCTNGKILLSLDVNISVDPRQFMRRRESASELLDDIMLNPSRHARFEPFSSYIDHYYDDGFELSQLLYEHNLWWTDVRSVEKPLVETRPREPLLRQQELILERHPCMFCQGFLLCSAYLASEKDELDCSSCFAELNELMNLMVETRPGAAPTPDGNGVC